MNMRGRILRLEKQAGVGEANEMTDIELIEGLRRLFRAEPERRWEDEFPTMGYLFSQILAEARTADTTSKGQGHI